MQWVDSDIGLRFAAPAKGVVVTGRAADDPDNSSAIEVFAAIVGTNPENVKARLRSSDVLVADRRTSIYVRAGAPDEFRTEQELEAAREYHGAFAGISTVSTPLGEGTVAYYPVRVGDQTWATASVYLHLPRGTALVLAFSREYDELSYQIAEMIPTFSDID